MIRFATMRAGTELPGTFPRDTKINTEDRIVFKILL